MRAARPAGPADSLTMDDVLPSCRARTVADRFCSRTSSGVCAGVLSASTVSTGASAGMVGMDGPTGPRPPRRSASRASVTVDPTDAVVRDVLNDYLGRRALEA